MSGKAEKQRTLRVVTHTALCLAPAKSHRLDRDKLNIPAALSNIYLTIFPIPATTSTVLKLSILPHHALHLSLQLLCLSTIAHSANVNVSADIGEEGGGRHPENEQCPGPSLCVTSRGSGLRFEPA